jgi:hypothetical protein
MIDEFGKEFVAAILMHEPGTCLKRATEVIQTFFLWISRLRFNALLRLLEIGSAEC